MALDLQRPAIRHGLWRHNIWNKTENSCVNSTHEPIKNGGLTRQPRLSLQTGNRARNECPSDQCLGQGPTLPDQLITFLTIMLHTR